MSKEGATPAAPAGREYWEPESVATTRASAPVPQLTEGFTVGGKYVIKQLLGEGANGSVYEGEHSQIGHRVAIKIVHKSLAAREDIIARFQREARICGTIRNRHVGQVYDVGELEDGAPYMVMELHEGRSLARVLREDGPLPIAAVVDMGRQLLLGLEAVHATGVVHRDIKPDNIMLVRESSGQTALKLVDFGIGKTVMADIGARNVTQEGMVVGSPDYMPPEQLKGDNVDQRVDLYAAGVVLYEALTGKMPFNATSLTELFVAILRDPVSPPSNHRSDCPRELERVILRAMEREADHRFQSATEMRRALEGVQRESGISDGGLTRYSQPPRAAVTRPKTGSSASIAHGVYALETERVRTAELQIPIKRAGMRTAVVAAAVALAGGLLALGLRASQGAVAHEAQPRSASAATGVERGMAKQAIAHPEPLPVGRDVPADPQPAPPTVAEAPAIEPKPVSVRPAATPGMANRGEPRGTDKKKHVATVIESSRERAVATPDVVKSASPPATPAAPPSAAPTELLQQAAAAFVRGQMPRARALYREATSKAAANPDAWRGLGMVSSRMGEREEAGRAFKRYLALRPNAPDADAIRKKLDGL